MRGATKRGRGADRPKRFQSTLPCGERLDLCAPGHGPGQFQSTLPVRGATNSACPPMYPGTDFNPRSPCGERLQQANKRLGDVIYFNPRSPCGERLSGFRSVADLPRFQSTLPVRGATGVPLLRASGMADFNPRSPCGERRRAVPLAVSAAIISIHAPRAGSDHSSLAGRRTGNISIHAPRAGSDPQAPTKTIRLYKFQSTLPVRGATARLFSLNHPFKDFNPRSPCGERPQKCIK